MVKYDNRPCYIVTGEFVFPKFLYARTTNNKTIDVSYAPQSMDAVEYIRSDSPDVDLEKTVEFECIGKKVKMTVQDLINYYIDSECVDVADECGF